jgi:hypothetical protein
VAPPSQGQQHPHVGPGYPVPLSAHPAECAIHKGAEAHEVDGQQEIVEIKVRSLSLPLQSNQVDQAGGGHRHRGELIALLDKSLFPGVTHNGSSLKYFTAPVAHP